MPHKRKLFAIAITVLIITAGTAYAQQPPDVVQSDAYENTAMGSGALLNNTTSSNPFGRSNTAAGAGALRSNTIGEYNTGIGASTLSANTTGSANTALGWAALSKSTGDANTASGFDALADNSTGDDNTASGAGALEYNRTGSNNTGVGANALSNNSAGSDNSAFGSFAMGETCDNSKRACTAAGTGNYNTAVGAYALFSSFTTGSYNTATGYNALFGNLSGSTGSNNTAYGSLSLFSDTTGSYNTASGYNSLHSNTTGGNNTAAGDSALYSNTNANNNTAVGQNALYFNTTGNSNSGFGDAALKYNVAGHSNTALGQDALYYTTGSSNVGLGANAGANLTNGSNNIDIGNGGVAAESGVIRIGAVNTQVKTYVAGIENSKVTGSVVYVTSSGQLGVLASSERYKTDIKPIGTASEKLAQLRAVSFQLKSDPNGPLQYGLIAEEVNKVYPELAIRDDKGKIQGIRYDELAPMLLNEMQEQRKAMTAKLDQQAIEIQQLKTQLAEFSTLQQEIRAAIHQVKQADTLVTQR